MATADSVPALVITLATSGRAELLKRTLDSLAQCALPVNFKETVIVENGPPGEAKRIVESGPRALNLRYMYIAQANKSAALNAVIETLADCFVFFTDDDVRFDPRVLQAYVQAAATHGPGHFFGGPVEVDYESAPPGWLRKYLPKSATGWEGSPENFPAAFGEFLGFNWAAYCSDIRAAGGFNPQRGPGAASGSTGQESDMQRRLLARGLSSVYVPEARVWHYVPQDRCSPRWAIDRAFRHGVEEGTKFAEQPPLLPGLPPWPIVRHYLAGVVRSSVWVLSRHADVRFKARHRLSDDRGLLRGYRYERKLRRDSANDK